MRIKVDEDLPRVVTTLLQEIGHEATPVVDQGMAGWKDSQLWQKIQTEGLFLITADKGFANIRQYPPGSHRGVMLLRPDQDGIRPILELLNQVLRSYSLDSLEGATTVVTSHRVRVRRAL